ncbi:hypothetical protein BDR22DRAFT_916153 [Usnea florida]
MLEDIVDVKITLTPLGQDEQQNHRTVTINTDNLYVSVGRASKNPAKGLLAAVDNAWFDYPILSRTHAKFTASRNQQVGQQRRRPEGGISETVLQAVYLQDCGSTHGTYIGKQRLEPRVEYAVADGQVITFGQRVTSGAVTYPAKHFRIHSSWEPRSEVQDSYCPATTGAQRSVRLAPISCPAFTNDFDQSSEPSREGSVQIVDSYRHTFSVPSSDDEIDSEDEEEEVQISSSVQGDEEEVSASTTPDRQIVSKSYNDIHGEAQGSKTGLAPGETRGPNLKGPSLRDLLTETEDGKSQSNPINVEAIPTDIIDVDTESEDDGPDVLPFYGSSKADQPSRPRLRDEPQAAQRMPAVTTPATMTAAEKQSDGESQRHPIAPMTQRKGSKGGLAESNVVATDGFDSEDDDGFDDVSDFLVDEDLDFSESLDLTTKIPKSSKPKVTFQAGSENPHYTTLKPPFDEVRPNHLSQLSVSDPIDVSQHAEPPSPWAQRAPSPSDAALARKAGDQKMSLSRDIFDNFPEPKWPANAKIHHSHCMEYTQDNAVQPEEPTGMYPWPELQSPEPRSYDQGPFSSQPKVVIPTHPSPKPDNVKNDSKKATVTWAEPREENDDVTMNVARFSRVGKQASKITIPSLVENYLTENPRSFKRKYGEVDRSNVVEAEHNAPELSSPLIRTSGFGGCFAVGEAPVGAKIQSWRSAKGNSTSGQFDVIDQDTPLPDAQPREAINETPNASLSQDSLTEPAIGPVSAVTTVPEDSAEGPARKKAKMSPSPSKGVGKFMVGVGVGLLSAVAAFVATIPNSVYEEALREFGNGA